MKRKVKYITTKELKRKKHVTENVHVKSFKIRYKDSKNRIVKFDARKKLRVEVVFRLKTLQKYRTVISTSYGLPLAKRKRPPSEKIIQTQFKKKHALKLTRGHLIVSEMDENDNLVSWSYSYQQKTKAQKAKERKHKRMEERRERERKGSRKN